MRPVLALFGPTAIGKTAAAVELALQLGGEVVNADAAQLYRGLDRGAAKITMPERRGVAHHLMDIADPDQRVSVAAYAALAQGAIGEVRRRGAVPILCGGSGLYLRAALGEWDAFGAPPDPVLRRWAQAQDDETLCARALAADPAAASISPHDRPRLVRAIERGGASAPAALRPLEGVRKFGLFVPRPVLYARIDARALALWPHLVREARRLARYRGLGDLAALRAIGYKEAFLFLDGKISEEEAIVRLQRDTRHFAKRQMTWWRREPDVIWLRPEEAVRRIVGLCGGIRGANTP